MPAEYGLSWILPRLVGLTRAADILLSGRILLAEELGEMGFITTVFEPEDFADGFGALRGDAGATLAGVRPYDHQTPAGEARPQPARPDEIRQRTDAATTGLILAVRHGTVRKSGSAPTVAPRQSVDVGTTHCPTG